MADRFSTIPIAAIFNILIAPVSIAWMIAGFKDCKSNSYMFYHEKFSLSLLR